MKKDKANNFRLSTIIYMALNIYVLSCWWCWWYGGSFGMRSLVQSYALLAIPMAAFYKHVFSFQFKTRVFALAIRGFVVLCLSTFLCLNLIQTYQFGTTIVHFDSMSRKAYWLSFGKFEFNGEDWAEQQRELIHPDYEAAMKGKRRN